MQNKKILQVCDRQGWAIDKLSKPLSDAYGNIDIVYKNAGQERFLNTGYSKYNPHLSYTKELALKYDIIHFHHPQSGAVDAKALPNNIRKIATKHTERDDIVEWNVFDDIVCPTKFVLEQMKNKNLKVKLHYVPYGIDLDSYKCLFVSPVEKVIGYVGRVVPWKRFDVALVACMQAKMKLSGCGYVEDSVTFRKEQRDYTIMKDFDFRDFIPQRSMSDFYSQMNLFLNLSESRIETGPLPVLEAMACGIPVISTKTGWANDWCESGVNIWFIEEEKINAFRLSKIIKDVYERPDIRNRLRNNALRLVQDFSIENYCINIKKIYD